MSDLVSKTVKIQNKMTRINDEGSQKHLNKLQIPFHTLADELTDRFAQERFFATLSLVVVFSERYLGHRSFLS